MKHHNRLYILKQKQQELYDMVNHIFQQNSSKSFLQNKILTGSNHKIINFENGQIGQQLFLFLGIETFLYIPLKILKQYYYSVIKFKMFKNKQPQCFHSNRPFAICINPICKQTPFICLEVGCQQKHLRCNTFMWNNLSNIMKSKNYINQHSQTRLKAITNTIGQLMINLESQITKLQKIIEIFKMNNQQKEFMNLVQNGNYDAITSKYVYEILQFQQNEILFDESELEKLEKQSSVLFENYIKLSDITNGILKTNSARNNSVSVKSQTPFQNKHIYQDYQFIDQNSLKITQNIGKKTEKVQRNYKKQKFSWAIQPSQRKHFDITNDFATKNITCKYDYQNSFLLMEPALPSFKQSSWIVQLIRGYMEVGVCIKSIISKNKYGFTDSESFKKLNHGIYTISPNYKTFSNHRLDQNNKKIGISFNIGDEILITYNPFTNKVRFTLNRTNQMIELEVFVPKGQQLHPCVWLGQQHHKVKLINI